MLEAVSSVVLGNALYVWGLAALAGVCAYGALLALRGWAARRLALLSERTSTAVDDMLVDLLSRTRALFLLVLAVRAAAVLVHLGAEATELLRVVTLLAAVFQGGVWADGAARFWSRHLLLGSAQPDPSRATLVTVVGVIGRIVVWTLVVLLSLQNLGVEVTALLAGLGVGGIAIALALQNILGDVFASLSIVLDRPFVAGDFIVVGDFMGAVEHVGLKTTRIRSLGGELLIFSNGDLLGSRIRNFGKMSERRVLFTFGVTYETPREAIARVPSMVREIIEALPKVRFDRAHFKSYGDFALIFEVVYYVLEPDYNLHMDLQQEINLKIFGRFADEGVAFAYPTQTVVLRPSGRESAC